MTDAFPKFRLICFIGDSAIKGEVDKLAAQVTVRESRFPTNLDQCILQMKVWPDGLLITDWQGKATIRLLESSRGQQLVDMRPILLIVADPSEGFERVLSDYHIGAIQLGVPQAQDLHRHIQVIFDPQSPQNLFQREYKSVLEYIKRRRYGDAIGVLRSKLADYPRNHAISLDLASLYAEQNQWNLAEQAVDRVLLLQPRLPRALHIKARCLMQRHKFDQAADFLERSTLLNPFHAERFNDLGDLLLHLSEPTKARAAFQKAQHLQASERAKQGMITADVMAGEDTEALGILTTLPGDRERASVFNNAGIIARRMGRCEDALKYYETAITIIIDPPIKARLCFNRALAFIKQAKRELAIDELERALKFDPNFAKAQRVLSKVTQTQKASGAEDWDAPIDLSDMDEFL